MLHRLESGAFGISREHSMHHGYRGYARVGTHSHKNSRTNAGLSKSVPVMDNSEVDSVIPFANCFESMQQDNLMKMTSSRYCNSRIPPEKQPTMKPFTQIRRSPCASAMASPRDVSPPARRRNSLHDRDYAPVETDVAGD